VNGLTNTAVEREGREGRKKHRFALRSFALAKPKLAAS